MKFDPIEATIAGVHEAMRADDLTSSELVERYRDRIAAYDRGGPALNSIITLNPDATERAAQLDAKFEADGKVGPLHGVPVLLKDQAMTAGLTTTFGSIAFEDYVPATDATIVTRLRDAGAVILAETNLPDWAAGTVGYSSVLGQTKNPYALDRDPGGSSAGTGLAVAANLGLVGIGEDTGGSIRVPSSCYNLFGIRVATGLVSRTGLSSLIHRQDTPGPMARTVEDLAHVLDVVVGYDPDDEWTGAVAFRNASFYLGTVDARDLDGARIGVLRQAFGDGDDETAPVTTVVEEALETLVDAGADIVDPVSIPNLDARLEETWLYALQSKHDIDGFLAGLTESPVDSFQELYESGAYHDRLHLIETIADGPADPFAKPAYWEKVAAQHALQRDILALHAREDLDAVVFPDVQTVPCRAETLHSGGDRDAQLTNTYVASQSGCPAVSMPAGFTDRGLPVGLELLGIPCSEPELLSMASHFESVSGARTSPETAPSLSD